MPASGKPWTASLSGPSSSSSLLCHSHPISEEGTMTGANSIPTASSSSVSSDESPKSVLDMSDNLMSNTETSHFLSSHVPPRSSVKPELQRIKELEQKRLVLRHQRFSLEQRLFEFCGKHSEGNPEPPSKKPARRVLDLTWKETVSAIRVVYSGPVNERDEPHGSDGLMNFSDGQVYRGDVRNGIRCGSGSNSWVDGQDYSGEWQANSRHGRGTHTWPDGRKVAGQWTEGHLNGKVYFSWPNGATFDGTCRMGKKHGRGPYSLVERTIFWHSLLSISRSSSSL